MITRSLLLAGLLAGVARFAAAQAAPPADSAARRIRDVQVTVTRDRARSPLELPFAITRTEPDSARPGQRHTSLDDMLALLPGVTSQSRGNPSQDPRLSIRGFGSRSAFGVRGVRVLRDGIPLTLPDGQTPVDYLDLESVGSIEVIRGSASALYGNAAGGVIDLRSDAEPGAPVAGRVRGWAGSDGLRRWVGAAGGTLGAMRYQANVARTTTEGFRRHARQETTSGFGRVAGSLGGIDLALGGVGFDMPVAENPGALTAAQVARDPRTADSASVVKGARKAVRQAQLGLTAGRRWGAGELTATLYGGGRTLDNPLTFAVVDVDRTSGGASLRGTLPVGARARLGAGVDVQRQDDDRRNFRNCNATAGCDTGHGERGALTLDQRELVTSAGAFARGELALGALRVSGGARADRVTFRLDDRFLTDGRDDSGRRTLARVSPMAGVVARVGLLHALYANISTAFETPTTTELVNQPDGSAGLNPDLRPQYATTYEVGAKGVLLARVRYDVAGFATGVRDELIGFDIPNGNGRRAFRNAGRTSRRGAEASLASDVGPLRLGAAYTYSRFRFSSYDVGGTSLAGRTLPGIPRQQLQTYATLRARALWLTAEGVFAGAMYVDDANSARSAGYELMHVRAGGTVTLGGVALSPVAGVQNLFGRRYVPSVVINADPSLPPARRRYFEPAPGRSVFVGLSVGAGR